MKISEKGWDRWSDNTSVLLLSISKDKRLFRDQRLVAQREVSHNLALMTQSLVLCSQVLGELYNSRFTHLASLQLAIDQGQTHKRPSTNAHLGQYFELTEAQETDEEAVRRMKWLEKRLPFAAGHRDALETTMKKASSNAANSRKAATLDESVLGWSLVSSSCYQWLDTESKTRKRKHETLAMAAIFEHILTQKYRPKLLARSSVAHLRSSLTEILMSHSKNGEWAFIDGLMPDLSKVPEAKEIPVAPVSKPPPVDKDTQAIMKIIEVTEQSIAASSDGSQGGAIDGHVSDALYCLVLVSVSFCSGKGGYLKCFLLGTLHECRS